MAKYNQKHEEIPDPTPVEMPVGYEMPESLESMIARMIKTANRVAAKTGQIETLEEADDFGEDEDPDELVSQYQLTAMQEEQPRYVEPKRQPNNRAESQPNHGGKTGAQAENVPPVQPEKVAASQTPVNVS